MLAINHLTGGLTFTATFCAFQDVNIFEKPEYLALTIFGSLAPDIDNTKSLIGKVFYPIAKKIQEHWGHRTVTHSFLACIVFTMFFATLQTLTGAEHLTIIAFFSYLSHLIFDMCTKSGLPFFYPLNRYRCVLPANPNLRLRTGDVKQEAIVFLCFILLNLLSVDLAANGFWSTYNKAFLTFSHLQRELIHNPKPLEVTIQNKHTGQIQKAFLVEAGADKAMLLDSIHFFEASTMNDKILDFEHVESKEVKEIIFEQITADSVNKLLNGNILKARIFGSKEFTYRHKILKTATSINIGMTKDLMVYELVDETENEELQKKLLQIKIFEERDKQTMSKMDLKSLEVELSKLQKEYENLSNFEKTKAVKRMQILKTEISNFKIYKPNLDEAQAKLEKLNNKEIIPTYFSGVVKTIEFKKAS